MARRHASRHFENIHIDMTPMVDCIMVLLVFLMVSTAFVEDPGIEVQKPDVGGGEGTSVNALLIAVSADDRIFFDGQEIHIDQAASLIRQAAVGKDPALIIRADRASSHGVFAAVYAAGKSAGITHVEFATAGNQSP